MNWKYMILLLQLAGISASCQKSAVSEMPKNEENKEAVDPELAKTIGFFIENWEEKSFDVPESQEVQNSFGANIKVEVDAAEILTKIPNSVYGHNANIWMSRMIDQPLFMQHITALRPNLIRWPAGSGSDAYFWNAEPGNLPDDVPKQLVDQNGQKQEPGYGYGKTEDNWRASLQDYYDMLATSGNQGVITVNYGYARYGLSEDPVARAAQLAADWVRFDKGRTKYWEIGNENFGAWEWGYRIDTLSNRDHQPEFINGTLYAKHFQVFADSMQKAAAEMGTTIHIGAVLFDNAAEEVWQTPTTKNWNRGLLEHIAGAADYYVVHNYFTPYQENSAPEVITDAALLVPQEMMQFIKGQMSQYAGEIRPLAMTEWNMWAEGSKQQVSNVSGQFATLVVCEAIRNQYAAALRWDLLNSWAEGNDHGLFSDGREPNVAKWTPRPSFYYLYFLQKMMGDRLVSTAFDATETRVKAYASSFSSGELGVVLVNTTTEDLPVKIEPKNHKLGEKYYWYSLQGDTDNIPFSRKVLVNNIGPAGLAGGPEEYEEIKAFTASSAAGVKVKVPARGAVFMVLE
ncbi:hypothetical protein LAG90_08030 [Marinilongibacter aquaticus]|uniref:hypothetical protein n=1 Tax=Marinilongibacter aquaticus TaxID=2975157 RepID=UPI0021BD2674|nr:hypothetical protein [Marinilongibacter aquaticus]UBM60588.1 hypothetical protein LAG90_08030 [Marinilongibacter aquaticus]